ncbi:O-antigen ligase family protein [Jannaschia sp. Os4]|uniref:O-antigen ligase family protein n=1 Tax=Jannaschia sp. Os4 TaxID=2807617 RepID=UPI0019397A3C|nr:O-antigen ligase family protein [Jannaschia sp. Os4]MBM2575147.1 O-antigen ligase family protein [Jannaschia sp. Os4]
MIGTAGPEGAMPRLRAGAFPRPATATASGGRVLTWVTAAYFAAVLLPLTVSLGGLSLTGVRILLLAVTLPLFVQLVTGRYGRLIATDWLLLAHVAVMGVTLMFTSPELAVTQAGSLGIEIYGSYLLGRAWVRTPDEFARLARWVVALVLLALPFAVVETMTGRPLLLEILRAVPGTSTNETVDAGQRIGLNRVQLTFPHPIHFGVFCATSFPLAMVAMRARMRRIRRLAIGALCAATALLSLSSGGLLAIAFQIALIGWATLTRAVPARWRVLVGLAVIAYVAVDLASNRSPIQVFMTYATFSPHTAYWRALIFEHGLQNVWNSPWVGIGFNDWERPGWMHTDSVDNYWLLLAMRHGVFGFLTMAAAWILLIARAAGRPLPAGGEVRMQRLGYVFVMLGLIFSFATVHAWNSIHAFAFLLLGAGAWFGTAPDALLEDGRGAPPAGPAGPPRLPGATRAVEPPRHVPTPAPDPVPAPRPARADAAGSPRAEARHSRFAPVHRRRT